MQTYVSITSQTWLGNRYSEVEPEMRYEYHAEGIPPTEAEEYVREVVLVGKSVDELKAISEQIDIGDKLYTVKIYAEGEEIMTDCAWLSMTAFDMYLEKEDEDEEEST